MRDKVVMQKEYRGRKKKDGTSSKYIGVSHRIRTYGNKSRIEQYAKKTWCSILCVGGNTILRQWYATEREAALAYDKCVIENNLDRPLNILKRVK